MHACLPVHSTQEGLVTFLSTILGCLLTAASQRATLENGAIKFISWSESHNPKRDFSEGGLNTGTEEKKLRLGRCLWLEV